MVKILNSSDSGFLAELKTFLGKRLSTQFSDIYSDVREIIKDVFEKGDEALAEYTKKFDDKDFDLSKLQISKQQINSVEIHSDLKTAIDLATKRIFDYHEKQKPQDLVYQDSDGITLGWSWKPVSDVGLYVPGGLTAYPSSVLMNAIPAIVAGTTRIVITTPASKGIVSPAILYAAKILEIDEIYSVGGAQAIAALAYGTQTVKPVYKIVGPGNAYVAEAKKQVFGRVGIDTVAGPSEILVVADKNNNPETVAIDLLSQAEHDTLAQSILITDSEDFADEIIAVVESLLQNLQTKNIARKSWNDFGLIIICHDLHNNSPEIINEIAPEHLEIMTDNPQELGQKNK